MNALLADLYLSLTDMFTVTRLSCYAILYTVLYTSSAPAERRQMEGRVFLVHDMALILMNNFDMQL